MRHKKLEKSSVGTKSKKPQQPSSFLRQRWAVLGSGLQKPYFCRRRWAALGRDFWAGQGNELPMADDVMSRDVWCLLCEAAYGPDCYFSPVLLTSPLPPKKKITRPEPSDVVGKVIDRKLLHYG